MKKNNKRESIIIAVILLVVLAVAFYLDAKLPSYHIAIKVIKKAAVYSLVAVSMNLLNGFTGLFSLGQAGFMLLGAYAYAVLSIPVDKRAGVYQYFNGGIVKFSLPEVFSGILRQNRWAPMVGMLVALHDRRPHCGTRRVPDRFAGASPAAPTISPSRRWALPRFVRAFFQWNALGPLTNGVEPSQELPGSWRRELRILILIGRVHRHHSCCS